MDLRNLLVPCLLLLLCACPTSRQDDDDAGDDDSAAGDDDTGDDDSEDCMPDYEPTFDGDGCLDWAGAQGLCGGMSDGTVCDLAVGCGLEPEEGQCSIDCEMLTTVACYDEADVQCVIDATCAADCEALETCGYFNVR